MTQAVTQYLGWIGWQHIPVFAVLSVLTGSQLWQEAVPKARSVHDNAAYAGTGADLLSNIPGKIQVVG
jgi:hypothetical protein